VSTAHGYIGGCCRWIRRGLTPRHSVDSADVPLICIGLVMARVDGQQLAAVVALIGRTVVSPRG